ncbi:hypothetical protein NL676_029778 [Syzygium grande]|nr:hypothetical protein NL676_029778 [Syzygium grande]
MPRGLGQLSSLHRLTRFILPKDKALAKDCCELGELNGLNDIRGSLSIENLGSVTDVVAESKAANLIGKHSLESLQLEWGDFDTDDAVIGDRDEALLGGLQPHSNLQKLTIQGYRGESFPKWMTDNFALSLPNLVKVGISSCGRCKRLPPLGQLSRLKTLSIGSLPELEDTEPCHSSTSTPPFPSLLELRIRGCMKLKAMPQTPRLEKLTLAESNPALINMIFELNKLKSLEIEDTEHPECLLEECLKSLTSLESLCIAGCHRLTSLSPQHLSNLVDLNISSCEELDLCKDESGNINRDLDFHGGLENLRSVFLNRLPKLASLPRWLLRLRNVERLIIHWCKNLKDLQDLEALQSLQRLEIAACPSLTIGEEVQERWRRGLGQDRSYPPHTIWNTVDLALTFFTEARFCSIEKMTSLASPVQQQQQQQHLLMFCSPQPLPSVTSRFFFYRAPPRSCVGDVAVPCRAPDWCLALVSTSPSLQAAKSEELIDSLKCVLFLN